MDNIIEMLKKYAMVIGLVTTLGVVFTHMVYLKTELHN